MSPRLLLAVMLSFFAASSAHAESFKSWAARGAREEREKDPKAAVASYSNALSLWDEDDGKAGKAKVLCARAGLREKDGDEPGAIEDLSGCLEIDKKNSKNFHRRGVLLLKAGKTAAAIGDFYKAVALNITFAQAYADRARAYEIQGETGFAHEDWRHACEFGLKAACVKVKEFSPKRAPKSASKKAKPKAAAKAPTEEPPSKSVEIVSPVKPAGAPEEAVPDAGAEKPAEEAAPVPVEAAPPRTAAPKHPPKFADCLKALDACVDNGDSYGVCVRRAPDCDVKAVKGCCPAACHRAYQSSLNHDRSEAQAFREHFVPGAQCGIPAKAVEPE